MELLEILRREADLLGVWDGGLPWVSREEDGRVEGGRLDRGWWL